MKKAENKRERDVGRMREKQRNNIEIKEEGKERETANRGRDR